MPIRELRDEQGNTWRVWEVHPGGLKIDADESRLIRVRERLSGGWLAFLCMETGARFRVAPPPADWHDMAEVALLRLGRAGEPVVLQATPERGYPTAPERGSSPV